MTLINVCLYSCKSMTILKNFWLNSHKLYLRIHVINLDVFFVFFFQILCGGCSLFIWSSVLLVWDMLLDSAADTWGLKLKYWMDKGRKLSRRIHNARKQFFRVCCSFLCVLQAGFRDSLWFYKSFVAPNTQTCSVFLWLKMLL